ncbi:MAG TPA: OB-fold nucleic acid binding domain-containing protein [Micromonospora sp.]|nr:OB-fold nucleic acid binding domain-containing protein [Micromonospora sp.]
MATDEGRISFRQVLKRLTATAAELEAQELQRESVESGSTPARQCQRGQYVSISGRLRTVVYTPRTHLPMLEAELYDGTGTVTLVFLGRRRIVGIEPGRQVTARGRLALRDDRKVIYNPYYELEAPR